jgi:hypothetical protein
MNALGASRQSYLRAAIDLDTSLWGDSKDVSGQATK